MQLSYTKVYHPDLKPAFIFLLLFALVSSSELWSQCSGFSVTVDAPNAESYCIGETITLNSTVIGGTAPYTYLWSTGGTGPNEDILATGWIIANLTVVDANGCIAFSNWAHIKPVFWDINIFSSPNSTCEGALELAVSIFGGTNGYDFLWSNGSTTFNTFVNTPGTYSVTVTEPTNGCDTVMNFTTPPFTPNSGPEPQITGPTTLCNGQSGTLSVVGNYASYLWAPNGETTQSISITGPGTYAVTVEENGSNCTGSDSYTVISSTSVQPQLSAPPLLCPGEQGIVSVVNSSNYTGFLWDTGETSPSINGTAPNTYNVTVTDINGCTETGQADIPVTTTTPPTISGPTELCTGQAGVDLTVQPTFNQYLWSTGETTQTINVSNPTVYEVTVTDANGCTTTGQHILGSSPPLNPVIPPPLPSCSGNPVLLEVIGGPFQSYDWSTGETTATILTSQSGTYTVTVSNQNGCTGVADVTVNTSPGPLASVSPQPYDCSGTINLQASGGTGFLWSTGESSSIINVQNSGTYSVTVTDGAGCTDVAIESVTVPLPTMVNISGPTAICEGGAGALTATPGFVDYLWSTGETTPNIDISTPGIYDLIVTDMNGCTASANQAVGTLPSPQPVISGPAGFCTGGVAFLELNNVFANILWSNGENSIGITVASPGNYNVVVTDVNGCTGLDEWPIAEFPLPSVDIVGPSSICSGSSAELSVPGNFSQITWSNGETTQGISVSQNGIYGVTVTDENGCTAADEQQLETGSSLSPQVTPLYGCDGTAELDAGGGFSSYLWANGETGQSISVTANGSYSVTVSDGQGCTGEAAAEVNMPPPPAVEIMGSPAACEGEETALIGSPGFAFYEWSTGETTGSISISQPGNYTLTATDANGCTATDSHLFSNFPAPSVDIVGPSSICSGSSAELSVPNNFSQITWSTGETTPGISVSQNGIYGVTVTDENGCTAADEQQLETGSSLSPQVVPLYGCDGVAELDAGGGFSSYLWGNGETGQSISVTANGSYSVTVSDGQGCTGDAAAEVNMPPPPTVEIMGLPAACEGAQATLSGSPGFAFYEWSTGETTGSISISQPGNYTLTATDANGCTATDSHQFSNFPSPSVDIVGPSSICSGGSVEFSVPGNFSQITWSNGETTPGISVSQNGIYGVTVTDENGCIATDEQQLETGSSLSPQVVPLYGCDGTAELDAGGGFSSYLWANGETGQSISVTANGSYSVTVSDGAGCTGEAAAEVNMPPPPAVEIMGLPAACEGEETALIGSPGFVFYEWSTGETTGSISISQPGNYTLTATDANGCTATDSHQFSNFPSPSVDIVGPSSICSGGSVEFSVPGNFSQITWSNGETTQGISVSQNGIYGVTVTDENGCTAADEQQLETGSSLFPNITASSNICDSTITLDAGGGYASYLWSDGSTTSTITVSSNGTYLVTVSDASGCSGETSAEVTLPVPPQINILGVSTLCDGSETTLVAPGVFTDFIWSNGETTQEINISQPGEYSVTATDANGCTATAEWSVTGLETDLVFVEMTTCNTLEAGVVEIMLTNQFGCDSLVITTTTLSPPVVENIELEACLGTSVSYNGAEIPAGETAEFLFTSASGCDSTVVVNVQAYAETDFAVQSSAACWNSADGSIEIDVQTGATPFLYSLDGSAFQALPNFGNLTSGNYAVFVKDANGCLAERPVQIPAQNQTVLLVEDAVLSCDEPSVILQPTIVSGNLSNLDWLWPDGSKTPWIETEMPGEYLLLLDDGCEVQEHTIHVDWELESGKREFFYIPNCFSPNHDGINDEFRIFPGNDFELLSFEFRIFDRWGNEMFVAFDPKESWDGIYKEIKRQPAVYVWFLKADIRLCNGRELNVFRKGGVTIVR